MSTPAPVRIEALEMVAVRFNNRQVMDITISPSISFEHHLIYEQPFNRAIYSTVVHLNLTYASGKEVRLRLSYLGRFRIDKGTYVVNEEDLYKCIHLTVQAMSGFIEQRSAGHGNIHLPYFN